jgi:enoyl-CoA hydratase/carnithine racemase
MAGYRERMPRLERRGDLHVLDLGPDANRINPDWIASVHAALDDVLSAEPPRGLVTTASGEFFSMGLDLEWMAAHPDGVSELVDGMHDLFARTLALPVPTVAAIPGHAIAGGAIFALAHDYRVMREDLGYFCLPEIDVQIAVSPGLIELVKARLVPQIAHEALTAGRRYTGREAADAGIAKAVTDRDRLLPTATEIAERLAEKDPATYGTVKETLYGEVLKALRDREANGAQISKFEPAMAVLGITPGPLRQTDTRE